MKTLLLIPLFVVLSGCAQIKMMLVEHDPALVYNWVEVKVLLERVECGKPEHWDQAKLAAIKMDKYAQMRDEPHKNNVRAVKENIDKASTSSEVACKRWVNLTNTRMDILQKAWGSR
jgi:hypothetical protein